MSNNFCDQSAVECSLAPPNNSGGSGSSPRLTDDHSIINSNNNNNINNINNTNNIDSHSHSKTTISNNNHPDQQHLTSNDLSPLFTLKDSLEQKLSSIKDFTKAVIYSDDGTIIVSTSDAKPKDITNLLTIFNDYDAAFENGVDLDGEHYDLHRFYDKYIYGRKGEGGLNSLGFAIARALRKNGRYIFLLITYAFPTISAKAVSTLAKFVNEQLSNL